MVVHVHTRGHFPHFLSDFNKIPSLLEEKKNVCEGKLGHGECYNALQTFQKNKSPGNDSLTVEFYLVFGRLLVKILNYAFEYVELSNSQKQAVITLVEKKGKDKRQIKNWRPISRPKRMETVLPEIIHFDQSAFVKGRTIFDAIRTIDDVIEHTMNRDKSRTLAAIDFEKAFDLSRKGIWIWMIFVTSSRFLVFILVVMLKKEKNWTFNWKILESIKKTINLWKWRGLFLIGRIQIVKTFAIRKLMFRVSAIQSLRISWKKLIRSFIILSGTERTK